jgi:hypothetical protein
MIKERRKRNVKWTSKKRGNPAVPFYNDGLDTIYYPKAREKE